MSDVLEQKFTDALAGLEEKISTGTKEQMEKAFENFEAKFKPHFEDADKEIKELYEDLKTKSEEQGKILDAIDAKMNDASFQKKAEETFGTKMGSFLADNFNSIKGVSKGNAPKFGPDEMKAVATMLTTGDHVTGDYPRDFDQTVVRLPGQAVNVSDLIRSIQIEGGTYTYVRETGQEGDVAAQTEGSEKPKVDVDFSHLDVTTDFIAGIVIYSKKMRNNLPYLQSFLPEFLRRRYFIAENTAFNAVLANVANHTASTEIITGKNTAEMITNELATLEGNNYAMTNGVVCRPSDWYGFTKIEKSTGAGYGLPLGWSLDNGVLRAFGVPVMKANWVLADKYYVGDWSNIVKVVTEGLSLEFSEQQRFSFNEIIARIEAQVAIASQRPESLIYGDFTAV